MTRVRTVDFLPEIFQTPANKQFLAATLDQLVQEPKYKKTQGWIGQRVGPGVTPNDHYVTEPTRERTDYQLEPGVVMVDPTDSRKVVDAITYPGITDAIASQGGYTDNAQRLYTSEYYTFDPFVDYDKFVNYSQYYWLPLGPDAVTVSATDVPTSNDFTVTRENGSYTFSSVGDNDPTLTLVRGGTYTFEISQTESETVTYRVTNRGTSAYVINYQNNPALTLVRGNTYVFNLVLQSDSLPFWIKTQLSTGTGYTYNNGVFNNGAVQGTVTFTVPNNAPNTLYYCCGTEENMQGTMTIVDPVPGTGPDFWIQAAPGVDGRMPATPNISSRDVYGVSNNGIDLGTVTFTVPQADAQQFYYDLNDLGTVDLLTTLQYDQINGIAVTEFARMYGGIDGITNLDNRTIAFLSQNNDPDTGGWLIQSPFDPLPRLNSLDGQPGSFDTTTFSQTDPITDPTVQYGIWQINYVPDSNGVLFMEVTSVAPVAVDDKFTVRFGTQYASTQWYKDTSGFFQRIPLLTAAQNTLFYQDGLDPNIFGAITLIEGDLTATLEIDRIIGQRNYTSPNGVVFTNGLKVVFRGNVLPTTYANKEYYVEGVGTAIQLLPVTNYLTPELYTGTQPIPYDTTPYDSTPYDGADYTPYTPDYLTISRASPDLNPWSRSNRWFHTQVIAATAAYNGVQPIYDTTRRGRRSILEYRGGIRLFDFGTRGLPPVNVVDTTQTNALLNVNGQTSYVTQGYGLKENDTVIFSADTDISVRSQVYRVTFITPDTVPPLVAEPYINLVPTSYSPALPDDTVVCTSGSVQGLTYGFDGATWSLTQQKTKVNQAPLFNVYDKNGISFSEKAVYPSSTFTGSKLFSYAIGDSNVPDATLGFPLSYQDFGIIGDILFDNNLYTDTFNYVVGNSGTTGKVSDGFVREYADRTTYQTLIGWQTAAAKSQIRQQFQFKYTGTPYIQLDVAVGTTTEFPAVQLFVNNVFQAPTLYTYSTTATTTTINFLETYTVGDTIEVLVLSDQVSKAGFYQVPVNLENNPFNGNSPQFTQGTVRMHYNTIGQNLTNLVGPIDGANNIRDLGNVVPFGQMILQQSSPMTLAGFFYRSEQFNIFNSLTYNSREYTKFKNQLLYTVVNNEYSLMSISEILDSAIAQINAGRTNLSPFYWSDMLPSGTPLASNTYTVTPITQPTFNTVQTYSFTESNYRALLVYHNNELLVRDVGYTVPVDTAKVTVTVHLNVGDTVTIVEYNNTTGNYVPNTPSKMGMWPAFRPEVFLDPNYITPTAAIRGHDGSVTVAFGDFRDEILLEFEKRIYNNIKMDNNPNPLPAVEVIPGFFRSTDYTHSEIQEMFNEEFLTWVGWNKVDYQKQTFIQDEPFTYNYSGSADKIRGEVLPGAWRGINRYFYDTQEPDMRPWEMLGFSVEPDWWTTAYGPVPWTSGNTVLWEDLQAGYVADPAGGYYLPAYARPNLTLVIPNGTQGQLLAPIDSVVGKYDPTSFRKSWVPGDGGPAEASWMTSSAYAFSVMRILALTRPAEFFSLYVDRDAYRFSDTVGQYLYNGRYRIDAKNLTLYGSGTSTASYINWIVDYNQQLGINSSTSLQTQLTDLDVRLCYRMASFTQRSNLKVFLERSNPLSNNQSLQIPDDDLNLLLYANQPHDETAYSALVIQIVDGGYAVYGYSNDQPYFPVRVSQAGGTLKTIQAGNTSVSVPAYYTDIVTRIPYGYVFATPTIVVDFILSYGKYLQDNGFVFEDVGNGYVLSWEQMAQEFLYFTIQGWATDTILNLNPSASGLTCNRPGSVVAAIESVTPQNMILDQNRQSLPTRNLNIQRYGDTFIASPTAETQQTVSYMNLKFTNYEDMIVFNNATVFQDLVYDPVTSLRQTRMKLVSVTTTEWDGTVDAQGFILNRNNVEQWRSNQRYTKGDIVIYKNLYWQALTFVQPSEKFDFSKWSSSNYTRVQEGLLPNIANKADQLADAYNTMTANLDNDQDLLAYNLIGFNPRQYMADIDLDDPSQVSLYQNFIPYVGTPLAAELLTNVRLNRFKGDYKIYENWAIQSGAYGATANRSFVELQLNQSLLNSNPATVQVITPQQVSRANQSVYLDKVWSESYYVQSTDILPTIYPTRLTTGLPSAGYVNLDDADITVFSLDDPSSIEQHISKIGIGTIIWVAKSNSYDWNVYRCQDVNGQLKSVTDNLDGTSVAAFNTTHNLSKGDLIVIKYFNAAVDGVYRVLATPYPNTITIAFQFDNNNQTTITGTGLVFFLQTARVKQASDAANLPYVNRLGFSAKVWVDNNGSGHWQVIQKQDTFTEINTIAVDTNEAYSQYGNDIAQSYNHIAALAGAPGLNTTGALYTFVRDSSNNYINGPLLYLGATDTVGYGSSVNFGYQNWAAAGAGGSNSGAGYAAVLYLPNNSPTFKQTQLLLASDGDYTAINFGCSVDVSEDERWLYVGARGGNKVYAYGRVDVQSQYVGYVADGTSTTFDYAASIVIDYTKPLQLIVIVNGDDITGNGSYSLDASNVVFTTAPAAGTTVKLVRRQENLYDVTRLFGITQDSTSGAGTGALFNAINRRGSYAVELDNNTGGTGYSVGDTVTISYTQIDPAGSAANDLVLTVTAVGGSGEIVLFTYTGAGISTTATFSLDTYLNTATNIHSFSVYVNDSLQRPVLDYTFNPLTLDFTFLPASLPAAGDMITVTASVYWQPAGVITTTGLSANADFGATLSTDSDGSRLVVGAPGNDVGVLDSAGSTFVFARSSVDTVVTDTSVMTYTIAGSITEPVSVQLNNTFLVNANQAPLGQGQFSVSGSTLTLTNVTLNYGDIIRVETNQFQLVQSLEVETPQEYGLHGSAVAIDWEGSSIYVGQPQDSTSLIQAGSVVRYVNQAQLYGTITSTVANPTLTAGDTIRINNIEVAVPAAPDNTVAGLAAAIAAANVPNATATASPDATFTGDGQTKVFGIGTAYSSATAYTPVVYLNSVLQTNGVSYSYNNTTGQIFFVTAPAYGANIVVVTGRLTVSVINAAAAVQGELVSVLPGSTGTLWNSLGFETYPAVQTIVSPYQTDYAHFGESVDIDTNGVNLVVGAPNGTVYEPMIFDGGETYFDEHSTTFFSPVVNSGVVYTYNYLPSATTNISNPGNFVFGQQIYDSEMQTNSQFGFSANYMNNRLLVGAPGNELGSSSVIYGRVTAFKNPGNLPAWQVIHEQQPVVDIYNLSSVYTYSNLTPGGTQTYFDFFDPLQGKILGAAGRNIDYTGAVDPAQYNTGPIHNNGNSWAFEHVGEIWWDTDTVRFINPNQSDISYAAKQWGQTFPGSSVDIYQWVESTVSPADYTGPGVPFSTLTYTTNTRLDQNGLFQTFYYFWVRGLTVTNVGAAKTLSTTAIASYISNPLSSGVPYLAPINSSTVAIYNAGSLLSATNTILHIGFDKQLTDDNIHSQYAIVTDGKSDSFLPAALYLKLIDSFSGINQIGYTVPDITLPPAMQLGTQFRPRQSFFADRFSALENYLTYANTILAQYPIVEMRSFELLNSQQPAPPAGSGAWDKSVANLQELGYQDIYAVALGYSYLVESDSTYDGEWAIYTVALSPVDPTVRILKLTEIQNYNTPLYWSYTNWYKQGFNSSTKPVTSVANRSALDPITASASVGTVVKVVNNGSGAWELYQRTVDGWERVALQNGTISFDSSLWDYPAAGFGFDSDVFDGPRYDQAPQIETRYVIEAINQQLFSGELEIDRNQALILMFNYIYTEQRAPSWLTKTSLIDVGHNISYLRPYQIYSNGNQDFVLDYLNEVKPYHTVIRSFELIYSGEDTYDFGNTTDFDCPAYWDTSLPVPQYVSPVLTPYTRSNSTIENFVSDVAPGNELWSQPEWVNWYNNYTLGVADVVITNGGSGYYTVPEVVVTGACTTPASLTAVISSTGVVIGVIINNPGTGYTATPVISFVGTGTDAAAMAVMGNGKVRSFNLALRFDRYQYTSTIVEWTAGVVYPVGTQVRYNNAVWTALVASDPAIFDFAQWDFVPADELSGVDRTFGYYAPTANMPGRNLPLVIGGLDYPGVQVVGNLYDTTVDLDAIYEGGAYLDPYLGTLAADVNVTGSGYINRFAAHAPEELLPGYVYDTLDLRVYTRPGGAWIGLGNGFPVADVQAAYAGTPISYAGAMNFPVQLVVFNQTTGDELTPADYTVDWVAQTVTVTGSALISDIIVISVYGLGGGNQLYQGAYNGADVNSGVVIPCAASEVVELAVFVNGVQTTGYTVTALPSSPRESLVTFGTVYSATDAIVLVAIGLTYPVYPGPGYLYSWSTALTQNITSTGVTTYPLVNSVAYTNPVNLVVTVDGLRVRTPAAAYYVAEGVTATFQLPVRLGPVQSLITQSDVAVYVDSVLLTPGTDWVLDADNPPYARTVTLTMPPAPQAQVLVTTSIDCDCTVVGTDLVFAAVSTPPAGSSISVTTWNDTREQNLITQVYVGPLVEDQFVSQGFDTTLYSPALTNNTPGSYDYSGTMTVTSNALYLARPNTDPARLWVTLNGERLFENAGFKLVGDEVVLQSGLMQPTDVVMITECTDSVTPEATAWRIFQDMRGEQLVYRMTPETTTAVSQPVSITDDIIYVEDAAALMAPNFAKNEWGVLTINGERIMYRDIDYTLNTVSSLLRGTAGTGAADHAVGEPVYNMGPDNMLPTQYQNYVAETTTMGDGTTTVYTAPNIDLGP